MQADPLLLEFAKSRPDEFALELSGAGLGDLSQLIASLPAAVAAPVSTRLPSWLLTGLLGSLEPEQVCDMLLSASNDDAVALVSHLHESHYRRVLEVCPDKSKLSLRQLFDFPSHSLASLATTQFIRVTATTTCGDFYQQLAYSGDTRARPILVVDEQGKYVGVLTL